MKSLINYFLLIAAFVMAYCINNVSAEGNKNQAEAITVVATGIGLDYESSFKNALSNAIQQALGTVVDAETLVNNETVIKDQVLTYSDGFVSEVQKIKDERRPDGLFESSIKATVQKKKLIEKLREKNISIISVDGTSLFAETLTQIKTQTDAKELFAKALEGLPIGLLSPRIVDQNPEITTKENDGAVVSWKMEILYNQADYYDKVAPSLQGILEQVCVDKSKDYTSTNIPPPSGMQQPGWEYPLWDVEQRLAKKYNSDQYRVIYLNIGSNSSGDNLRWNWYVLDEKIFTFALNKFKRTQYPLRIELIGLQGGILKSNELKWDGHHETRGFVPNVELYFLHFPFFVHSFSDPSRDAFVWMISPFFFGSVGEYHRGFSLNYITKLSLEEMKNLKEIKCYFIEEEQAGEEDD
ncbi:MAG: hypothetical protein AB1724_10890 [Thermodesulfobacteriota bacterium]